MFCFGGEKKGFPHALSHFKETPFNIVNTNKVFGITTNPI